MIRTINYTVYGTALAIVLGSILMTAMGWW